MQQRSIKSRLHNKRFHLKNAKRLLCFLQSQYKYKQRIKQTTQCKYLETRPSPWGQQMRKEVPGFISISQRHPLAWRTNSPLEKTRK